jgi:glycosyltransferase involved in cell wall biosynthesis
VDDSDNMEQSISDKIAKIQHVLPGLNVVYVPYHEKITIGGKRNLGVKRASHDIILMMDDDDHYPETSFRRRVAYLAKNPEVGCAVCTTIALYDLRTGVSAVNVPPYDLPLGKRISEATLTFRRSFFMDRKFEKISMAEGDPFIAGRELQVVEMMPQQIIVSFCHGSNSSSRRIPPSDVKPACFWGFPPEFLKFVHGLAGVELELADLPSSAGAKPAAVSAAPRSR